MQVLQGPSPSPKEKFSHIFSPLHIINYKTLILRRRFFVNNNKMDINQLLSMISKMDKKELEQNIYRAQQILNNSDIKKNFDKQE